VFEAWYDSAQAPLSASGYAPAELEWLVWQAACRACEAACERKRKKWQKHNEGKWDELKMPAEEGAADCVKSCRRMATAPPPRT